MSTATSNANGGASNNGKIPVGDERISWLKGIIVENFPLKDKQFEKLFDSDEFRYVFNLNL